MVVVDVEGVVRVEGVSAVWTTTVAGEGVELGLTACVLVAELTLLTGAAVAVLVTSFPSLLTD